MMTEPTTVSGRGHGIPVSVLLVLIVGFVFLYCSCESREHLAKRQAEHDAKRQVGEDCFKKATNGFSECLDRQGLSQDFGDEEFRSEEYAECSEPWLDATDSCGYESFSAFLDRPWRKKEGCEANVAIRWNKCVGERVLAGRSDKEARSDCLIALMNTLFDCGIPERRSIDNTDVWERVLRRGREWDSRRAEVLEGRGEEEDEE